MIQINNISKQYGATKVIHIADLTINRGKTILISSHDINHTVETSTRIIALNKGELVKDIQTSTQTLQELESFFTV